ncbi:hypothetical protein NM688_g9160 [Phlebia brevispora]|uniref:Uncharacterized protein n=1 Tax=Phlebia brevispora TaxID=194682 RepID=A0ACC1RK94_9APHY|nr:hypothetical protein NM688_g9160 [Phlebia brevispora]
MAVSYDTVTLASHAHIVKLIKGALARVPRRVYSAETVGMDAVASATILVESIWKSPSLFTKIFYLIIRYPTFVDTSLIIVYFFTPRIQLWHCVAYYVPAIYIFGVGLACTELVLIWRTYALWNGSRRVLVGLLVMWIMWVCGNLYPVLKFARSLVFVVLPGVPGCYLVSGDSIVFTFYASLLAVEIGYSDIAWQSEYPSEDTVSRRLFFGKPVDTPTGPGEPIRESSTLLLVLSPPARPRID